MAKDIRMQRKLTQDNFVTEKIDVIQNNLLGSYDDDGNYVIAPQIVEELIALEKIKKTAFGNSIFCVGSLLGYGELVFELLFDSKTSRNNAAATLYLLEDVDKINGYLQNTIKTKLEDFNRNVDDFIEATYAHFNIQPEEDDDEDEGKERKLIDDLNSEDSFIIAKKQFSILLEKLLSEKYLDAYGKYFTSRMSMLTKLNNEFSQSVLNSFNRQYQLIENVFLHEKNYKMLNELMDKCIEEVSGTSEQMISQEKDFNNRVAPALETFTESMDKLSERYEAKALHMLDKDDREKVEEILDGLEDNQVQSNSRESKQNADQIANEVKLPPQSQRQQSVTAKDKSSATQQEDQTSQYIKDMLDSKKQAKENLYTNIQQTSSASNNASTTETNTSETRGGMGVGISMSRITPESTHKSSASSLQSRINRLQKFKEDDKEMSEDTHVSRENLGGVMDRLSKQKELKSNQVEQKNFRTRENMENLHSDPKINEYLRQRSSIRQMDDMDMER